MTKVFYDCQQTAYLYISPVLNGLKYLPQTNSTMDPHSLIILLNDIIINDRKSIIEFGSGVSTIIIAHLIRINELNTKFWSVESNLSWYNVVAKWIELNELESHVELVYAPLEPIPQEEFKLPWYSISVLERKLSAEAFDMIIVDGPKAFHKRIENSRYPALFFVSDKLVNDYSLFLHDSDRFGEKTILRNWENVLNMTSAQFTEKLSGFIVGNYFDIHFDNI